jgi:hypothetical protein
MRAQGYTLAGCLKHLLGRGIAGTIFPGMGLLVVKEGFFYSEEMSLHDHVHHPKQLEESS